MQTVYFTDAFEYRDKNNKIAFSALKGERADIIGLHETIAIVKNLIGQRASVPIELLTENNQAVTFTTPKILITKPDPFPVAQQRSTSPVKRANTKVRHVTGATTLF